MELAELTRSHNLDEACPLLEVYQTKVHQTKEILPDNAVQKRLEKTGAEEGNPISEEVCANDDFLFTPAKMESVTTCLIPVAVSRTMHDAGGSELSAAKSRFFLHITLTIHDPGSSELSAAKSRFFLHITLTILHTSQADWDQCREDDPVPLMAPTTASRGY